MALGGTIRGKKTTLRLPAEADLETYNRWMADMRVRRAHSVWREPAMPATWKERFKETAKEKMDVLWSIDAEGGLIGLAAGSFWSVTESGFTLRQFVIDPEEWRKGLRLRCGAGTASLSLRLPRPAPVRRGGSG